MKVSRGFLESERWSRLLPGPQENINWKPRLTEWRMTLRTSVSSQARAARGSPSQRRPHRCSSMPCQIRSSRQALAKAFEHEIRLPSVARSIKFAFMNREGSP
eukprot:scaffold178693_cov40-Tisochrysis_lutea.AAC.1